MKFLRVYDSRMQYVEGFKYYLDVKQDRILPIMPSSKLVEVTYLDGVEIERKEEEWSESESHIRIGNDEYKQREDRLELVGWVELADNLHLGEDLLILVQRKPFRGLLCPIDIFYLNNKERKKHDWDNIEPTETVNLPTETVNLEEIKTVLKKYHVKWALTALSGERLEILKIVD